MHVHRALIKAVGIVPHTLQKLRAGVNAPGVGGEHQQHLEFNHAQAHFIAVNLTAEARFIHRERPADDVLFGFTVPAAQNRPHAGN